MNCVEKVVFMVDVGIINLIELVIVIKYDIDMMVVLIVVVKGVGVVV